MSPIKPYRGEDYELGPVSGATLRNEAIARVLGNESERWKNSARNALEQLAEGQRPFNADDLVRMVGRPPHHPNSMGGIFNWGVHAGLIVRYGERQMRRPQAHARRTATYIGSQILEGVDR